MGDTFSKIQIHIVFAVKYRRSMIDPAWKEDLFRYITGIVQDEGHKMLAINGVSDHVHLFIGYVPRTSLSDLVRQIKGSSSRFINKNHLTKTTFRWQEGYGAFVYSPSHIDGVVKYIHNQERHHQEKKFRQEFERMLITHQIPYDPKYLPKDPE